MKNSNDEELSLVFNRGFVEGQFSHKSKRSIRAGHMGLKIGKVIDSSKNQIAVRIDDAIKTLPEKGDGLLIVKKNNDYGLEISQNPIITTSNHYKKGKNKQIKDFARKDKVMIVKKVWQNKKSTFDLTDSNVYLTKRNNLSKKVKEIETKGKSFIKSKLTLTFSLKNKFPHLKGRLTLANRRQIECEIRGDTPFEKPLKKSVTSQTVEKQLAKTDSYPYEITQININYDGTLFIPISKLNELRRNLFEELKREAENSYKHEYKKITLTNEKIDHDENPISFSFYTNNLNHLKKIDNVRRVYLEIPPEHDDVDITGPNTPNINYMVNFIKEALEISYGKDYDIIWKWPDITHDKLIKTLNKVRGILNKMHYSLPIMTGNFNGEYGPYSMNITNTQSLESLENYRIITLSPELTKKDYEDIMNNAGNPQKIEMLVQGSVELMKSRYSILSKKEFKQIKNRNKFYLTDRKNNRYPIHKSISQEELEIFDDSDLSLINEINHLKKIGFCNFSIDGRWRDDEYYKMIDIYKQAIKGNINEKELLKYSPKNTLGNY